MHSFLFVSRGRYTALTGFFMLCTLTVALALGTGIASAGPAGGHNQDVVSIKQALTMKDKSTTAINGTITKIMNGNRYMVSDHSGQAEVQIVPSVLGGQRLAAGDNVLLQVEIKKNKIEAKNVIKQQNLNQKHIPDPKHDPDPKHIPGPGANTGHSPISGPATNPGHSPNPVPGPVGGNIGHANDVSIRQALTMKDKTNVAIRGNITKIMGGNKYTVADNSGSAEVHIGPKALNGQRLAVGDSVLLQGEIKRDKKQNIIEVNNIVKQQGHGANIGHGPNSAPGANTGHGPNTAPGPGQMGGNTGHANDVVSIRQALGMKDKTNVAIRGNITKIMGGNKYTVADNSGSAEVQIGSKELNGQRLSVGDNVLLYGEVKKDKKQNIIKVKQVLKQQNSVPNRGHDHNPGHGR